MRLFSLVALPLLVDSAKLSWSKLDVKLRTPVSDMTTTLGSDGLVYIAGGCIHASGSVYNPPSGILQCFETTDQFYSFDPDSNSFTNLPRALRNRYRHASAIANGKLYLVGGLTTSNDLILEVDVSPSSRVCCDACCCSLLSSEFLTLMLLSGVRHSEKELVNHRQPSGWNVGLWCLWQRQQRVHCRRL